MSKDTYKPAPPIYLTAFARELNELVIRMLDLPNTDLGPTHANQLYQPELQRAAADAGYQIDLSASAAVAYMVISESSRRTKEASPLRRMISASARESYRDHTKMLRYGNALMEAFYDELKFGYFVELVGYNLIHQAHDISELRTKGATRPGNENGPGQI